MHGGADALAAGVLTGSMHGARSYWRIMRAAAAAAKLRNRAPCLALTQACTALMCGGISSLCLGIYEGHVRI